VDIFKRSASPQGAKALRAQLIRAAAEALLLDEDAAVGIASSETAAFVQTSRQPYRAAGFNFTDTDLRYIHETVRGLVVRRGLHRRIALAGGFEDVDRYVRDALKQKQAPKSGARFVTTTPGKGSVESN
jgi:hypothetical protein